MVTETRQRTRKPSLRWMDQFVIGPPVIDPKSDQSIGMDGSLLTEACDKSGQMPQSTRYLTRFRYGGVEPHADVSEDSKPSAKMSAPVSWNRAVPWFDDRMEVPLPPWLVQRSRVPVKVQV